MWYKVNKIRVGTQQVRPSWWTPWSNTLFYLPLESDTTDHSWRNIATNPSNITYWTLWGVNCAIANGSSSIITFNEILSSWLTEWTVSVLLYKNYEDTSSDDYKNILYYRVTNMWFVWIDSEYNWWWLNYRRIWWYVANRWNAYITSNLSYRWHHLLFTFNNSVAKYYIDGNKISEEASSTSRVWWYWEWTWWNTRSIFKWNPSANSYWKWWAREIIFEKKMWSESDIVKYFNKIKSQYWIS